jgi:hypothetical protein
MSEFQQPSLADADKPAPEQMQEQPSAPATVALPVNTGKTDELSLAVKAAKTVIAPPPPPPQPAGKYCLDYAYNGEAIHETHVTVRGALARVRDLKRMGIIAATSTAS